MQRAPGTVLDVPDRKEAKAAGGVDETVNLGLRENAPIHPEYLEPTGIDLFRPVIGRADEEPDRPQEPRDLREETVEVEAVLNGADGCDGTNTGSLPSYSTAKPTPRPCRKSPRHRSAARSSQHEDYR